MTLGGFMPTFWSSNDSALDTMNALSLEGYAISIFTSTFLDRRKSRFAN